MSRRSPQLLKQQIWTSNLNVIDCMQRAKKQNYPPSCCRCRRRRRHRCYCSLVWLLQNEALPTRFQNNLWEEKNNNKSQTGGPDWQTVPPLPSRRSTLSAEKSEVWTDFSANDTNNAPRQLPEPQRCSGSALTGSAPTPAAAAATLPPGGRTHKYCTKNFKYSTVNNDKPQQ